MSNTISRPPAAAWDAATWRQLSSIDLRLLDELAYLCRRTQERNRSGAAYAFPGRKYLAAKLGCSIVTVSRHVAHLTRLGILDRLQRRKWRGTWQTNLYRLIHPIAWRAARLREMLQRVTNRVSRMTHIAPRKGISHEPKPPSPDFDALLARWTARGGPSGGT